VKTSEGLKCLWTHKCILKIMDHKSLQGKGGQKPLHIWVNPCIFYSRKINRFGTSCWHRFLEKHVKRDKEGQSMRKPCNRPIEEKEGWSARPTDGQRCPTSSINGPGSSRSADGQPENQPIQGDTPKGKARWRWVNPRLATSQESVLGSFDSCVSLFLFLVVFDFFRCK
jgi:hypothetical protein